MVSIDAKGSIFSSILLESLVITSEKLIGDGSYRTWVDSVEIWFIGQGYEDHLTEKEADILEADRAQWRTIDA